MFKTVRQAAILTSIAALLFAAGNLPAEMSMKTHMGNEKKMMEKMTKKLGLTKEQSAKMKALHDAQHLEGKTLYDKMDADVSTLKTLVKGKATDADLTAATAAVQADHRAMMDSRMAHHEAMQAILTPGQKATMVLEMCEHMDHEDMAGMGMDDHRHK
jgi:Spy/CpxP family protein refolding chaperone